ncbi:uncharacterized protein PHACADRAFT_251277 [Phanerochaete carnosa HHB-10118-sp]|uniref:Uncharacterized protein n=1 Tax=Phanerochaete carnosa (strain HHB-10118-sp) TaxID=650164 RepID=K5WET3_PHACS|nr:uncharacterized protein PHACADRAFT_251277 [Phanerochaete carnosa HHB-10118-sp]EKM57584.1 hypothetical protein PHACADRAFT_251277 [Phanerochaete carnosa HHB-10118-sp]
MKSFIYKEHPYRIKAIAVSNVCIGFFDQLLKDFTIVLLLTGSARPMRTSLHRVNASTDILIM